MFEAAIGAVDGSPGQTLERHQTSRNSGPDTAAHHHGMVEHRCLNGLRPFRMPSFGGLAAAALLALPSIQVLVTKVIAVIVIISLTQCLRIDGCQEEFSRAGTRAAR